MKSSVKVQLKLPALAADRFTAIWGAGVGIVTQSGILLTDLLCDQLGIDRSYVDNRIQTVFVNGRAVDRLETVYLSNRNVVALSAAMPGLVGATFRKQGLLASFREGISHHPTTPLSQDAGDIVVRLKLFNLVARELGPPLLQQGVRIKGKILEELITLLTDADLLIDVSAEKDGRKISMDGINSLTKLSEWIDLRVHWQIRS